VQASGILHHPLSWFVIQSLALLVIEHSMLKLKSMLHWLSANTCHWLTAAINAEHGCVYACGDAIRNIARRI